MIKIIAVIDPFMYQQKIYVFDNQTLKMDIAVPMTDMPERIVQLYASEHATEVDLRGLVDYTSKMKQDIKAQALSLYGRSDINVNLV